METGKMGQKGTHICELYSRKQFRHPTLPLSIEMFDYKSTTDKWHRHTDFYELVIVCSGKARNENSRRSEQVHAGHVYLLPSGSGHRYAKLWNFRHYNILFQPQILDIGSVNIAALPGYSHLFHFQFDGEDRCSLLLSVDETILSQLISMIETVRNEMALRLPGWQEAAYFEFMRMLVHLLRHCVPQDTGIGQNAFQIGRAIRAMEEDCTQQFTLKSLADMVHMSQSSFRHHFTEITGIPPGEYLLKLRLKKALLMLMSPNRISNIAAQCGFRDNNYFSRQFRKQLGMPPRNFHQEYMCHRSNVSDMLKKLYPDQ